jgi:hypothetical protein
MKTNTPNSERRGRDPANERGAALAMVVFLSFLAVSFVGLMLGRASTELADSKLKSAKVKTLFAVNSSLARAHQEINESYDSAASMANGENVALTDPEQGEDSHWFIENTNRSVQLREVKPSNNFDEFGNELPPTDEAGAVIDYEDLPWSWYCLEAKVYEPMFQAADGTKWGQLKVARQYVRDGTPLSNNFLAVIDDNLGLGGSAVNPGKPAEGEIQTNKHLYIMTSNPYYANRLLSVTGVSYTAGGSEANTVFLHPDNNFAAEPLYLPLPSSLTSNPEEPDDTLKNHALGSTPTSHPLDVGIADGMSVTWNGITSLDNLKKDATDPQASLKINYDEDGICRGVCVEGYNHHQVTMQGDTFTLRITKYNDENQYVQITGIPAPQSGVLFFDTRVDITGGSTARTTLEGDVSTRLTMATTANVDIVGSIRYTDSDGDYATKMVRTSELNGVAPADYGSLAEVAETAVVNATDAISYFANKRPPGVPVEEGDGFYDNDAVLGVVASNDVIFSSQMPQNGEIAGSFLSLQKRLTLEGLTYNAAGSLTGVSGSNPFFHSNGGRSALRRFGGMISYKRPCTTVVTGSGSFYYGFKTGFSLFDEDLRRKPPPFFPKDKKPQYLGWELRDLGVKPIAAN